METLPSAVIKVWRQSASWMWQARQNAADPVQMCNKLDGLAMSMQTVPAAEPAMLAGLYSTLRVLQLLEGLHIMVGFI